MADEVKRIEVDIGAAASMLEASPELCAMMNELVGGPARVEAQAEIDRLRDALEKIIALDIHHKTYGDGSESTGCGPIALIAKRALGRYPPAVG